ncbi:hypothetical protein EJ110_NYTH42547 [Nymphaea thermarum]|nr:hypothetical protein EJ110_NYTH42547 [Nymphaea thermarum]
MAASSSSTISTDQTEIRLIELRMFQLVTTIRLTKENYVKWSAAITMGIAGQGRIAYVNGNKVELAANSMAWETWFLENNQMYGQKKRKVHVYQLMKDLYALRQGDLSVDDFYAALKSKWEDLDYHFDDIWSCPQDQMHYMTKEWENRIFLFLVGLNDEFENIRSQILNSEESFSIEDVYSRVKAEEQRRLVINGRKGDHMSHNERSAFVSRASMGTACSSSKCTHCKKLGHTMEFCWDLHPEKKNSRGRSSGGKKPGSNEMNPSDGYNEPWKDEEEEANDNGEDDEYDINLRTDVESSRGKRNGIMYEGCRSGPSRRKRRGAPDIRRGHGPSGRSSVGSIRNFFPSYTSPGCQPHIYAAMTSKDMLHQTQLTVGKWFYDACIPFNAANSFQF